MTIGENIKKIRSEKHMTQKELGEKLGGISQQQIGQWETGKANPKIETIQKIATALKVSLNDLMPDSFERTQETGRELMATDYSFIESMANHKIFSDKERKKIFEQIEKHRAVLFKINDIDELEEYSEKTHCDLEKTLLNMILDKFDYDIPDIIVVLSCFLSLNDKDRNSIIDILLNNCYPDTDLKYWS